MGVSNPGMHAIETTESVPVLDSTIAFRSAGQAGGAGDGPTFVLLHGNPSSSYAWRDVLPVLGRHGRALAPDLIGMGDSGKPAIAYGFADSARYLDAWFTAVGLDGADVVLVGHDHDYERFAPQDANGHRDVERGLRQFVVGTGGHSLRRFPRIAPNSEVRDSSTFGVLQLTLGSDAYAWRFRPAVGSFTDAGSASCH